VEIAQIQTEGWQSRVPIAVLLQRLTKSTPGA
jgi:hypothetical protein